MKLTTITILFGLGILYSCANTNYRAPSYVTAVNAFCGDICKAKAPTKTIMLAKNGKSNIWAKTGRYK